MSIGSVLIGLALALVVGAWLARPFRRAADPDRAIEHWVAQARAAHGEPFVVRHEVERSAVDVDEDIHFCPRCGRRVGPEDRFCARCGASIR